MSFKMRVSRFTRTAYVMDLRTPAIEQELKRIRNKAIGYMMANKFRPVTKAVF